MSRLVLLRKSELNADLIARLSLFAQVIELDLLDYQSIDPVLWEDEIPQTGVLASMRAVDFGKKTRLWDEFLKIDWICVGERTASRAKDEGLSVLHTVARFREIKNLNLKKQTLFYPCSSNYHRQEVQELSSLGIDCRPWELYKPVLKTNSDDFSLADSDYLVAFSSSQASAMLESYPSSRYHKLFVMGPRTAQDCLDMGYLEVQVSKLSTLDSLIELLSVQFKDEL